MEQQNLSSNQETAPETVDQGATPNTEKAAEGKKASDPFEVSQYHAVLATGSDITQVISGRRRFDLRKEIAANHPDAKVLYVFRGKRVAHTVQQQVQF